MLELYGKEYYVDIDSVIRQCQVNLNTEEEKETDFSEETTSINVFKFDLYNKFIDKILSDYEESDEELGVFGMGKLSPSSKLAFNTLLKYNIIKEDE